LHIIFKSVEILSAAAPVYEKSHLTIDLACDIQISPLWVTPLELRRDVRQHKTRTIALSCATKCCR